MSPVEKVDGSRAVVVLGSARSGTSVVAGLLSILGVDLGPDRSPDETNPTGYNEDEEFSDLISDIVRMAGGETKEQLPSRDDLIAVMPRVRERVLELCRRRAEGSDLWGWKQPATVLVADVFLSQLTNPHLVLTFRNPLGVARSYVRRERTISGRSPTILEALAVDNRYNREIVGILARYPEVPHILTSYEDVIEDPIGCARELATFLGLRLTDEHEARIRALVSSRDQIGREKRKTAVRRLLVVRFPRFLRRAVRNPLDIPRSIASACRRIAALR